MLLCVCAGDFDEPHSKTALTQLLGRILRQPYARKTNVPALDESYVILFPAQQRQSKRFNGRLQDNEGFMS